jgi:hypothetical protein
MRKIQNLSILISLALLWACSAPKTISKADFSTTDSTTSPGKLYYNLPTTVINIEVTARKVTEKRGPYYRYSERYLNLSDIITEDNEYWEITGATIYTTGIPDSNRFFSISAEGTPAGAAVNLTPDGTLLGFNLPPHNSSQKPLSTDAKNIQNSTDKISFDDIPFTEEQLIKTSGAATAEEVTSEIYNIRDSRRRLLEGDIKNLPPDEGSYQRILEGLDRMEKQYLSLFKGKIQIDSQKRTFTFIPDANTSANQVFFRFSNQKGFAEIDDMTGTPVYIEVLSDEVTKNNQVQMNPKDRTGMIYCKPKKAIVKIVDRTKLLTQEEILIGQYGTLHTLPVSLLDNPDTVLELDPATGAIVNIRY